MGKDYERICEWGNLYDAYLKARRGKRWKNSVAKVEASALEAVALIQRELQTRTYRPGGYRAFYVYEPKRRLMVERIHLRKNPVDPMQPIKAEMLHLPSSQYEIVRSIV